MEIEKKILNLIATDRISVPINSIGGKLYRARPNLASAIGLDTGASFEGDRCHARVVSEDKSKARGMRRGIEKFSEAHPKYGRILEGYIQEERTNSEVHFYFGMNEGRNLTSDDYLSVMTNLGFTRHTASRLYPELMEISRNLARKRNGAERSVLIG